MKNLKFLFLGTTQFSKEILLHLINQGLLPSLVISTPESFSISYSERKVRNCNYVNLKEVANQYGIPIIQIDTDSNESLLTYIDEIKAIKPDLILVMGWYFMVPKKIRDIAQYGAWGLHASLLPKYAGGAPLTWAIINGENETGVSLFKLDNGVDDGDIIMQKKIPIDENDSIKEVYGKATLATKEILTEVLSNIDDVTYTPQDKSMIEIFPQRSPEDGEININQTAVEIYNFIRAQSSPYPGAYILGKDKKKVIIEKARIE